MSSRGRGKGNALPRGASRSLAIRTSVTARQTDLSRWDRFLLRVAPQWGLRRLQARDVARSIVSKRHYDAGQLGGRRTENWRAPPTDANTAQGPALMWLRNISRDLKRNNVWARRIIKTIPNDIIGWGIRPNPRAVNADGSSNDALNKRAIELWDRWAGSVRCDYSERRKYSGLQRLGCESMVEGGEYLIRRHLGGTEGMEIPLRIQYLEPDYLALQKDGLWGDMDGPIIQGVEYSDEGRRVAFWMFDQHPGAFRLYGPHYIPRRVPAENVRHVFNEDRIGQNRGVPWLCAAIAKLQDGSEWEDAALMKAKVAACFVGVTTDLEGNAAPSGQLDTDDFDTPPNAPETLEPGMMMYWPPGKDVKFSTPPQDPGAPQFSEQLMRAIAAGIPIPATKVTGDWTKANFSNARMERIDYSAHIHDWRWHTVIPQDCDGIWTWFNEMAIIQGLLPAMIPVDWTPPPLPSIDPEKEGRATSLRVRAGMQTHDDMVREQGYEPEAHWREYKRGLDRFDELKITVDSDARQVSQTGQAQVEPADPGGDPGTPDKP